MDKKYHTGLIWQDFQHRELLELFVKLQNARADNKDKTAFNYAVAFLAMYVHHHFRLEEAYMDIYRFPGRRVHKEKHREFITTVRKFRAVHAEYSQAAVDELIGKLNSWILDHILGEDKLLSDHIRAVENREEEL